jgi:DNA excision repair protein ERCC-3
MAELLSSSQEAIRELDNTIAELTQYRDSATAEIAKHLRVDSGIDLDVDAIRATLTRPYTILPINEHEAWLIHWRGIRMPIFGWVVAQEPAFIKAKVTRSMDLLTPLPGWMKDEMGWKAPAHKAIIDGPRTGITLTDGDEATFKRRYGQHLGAKQADGTFKIKGGDAWIKLVAALVRDGILPYTPQPVAQENWDENAELPNLLFDIITKKQIEANDPYIMRAVGEFKAKGAVLVNYPPGSGKTLVTCAILNHFHGRVLILGDSTMLVDQWRDRVKTLAAYSKAQIVLSTYQGAAKYLHEEWDLIIPDEAQRLPANTFSKLAFAKTKYRLGLTGTAWREDERQHLIVALSGFPVAIRWASLIASGALRRPRIIVATVPNDAAKTTYVRGLLAKRKGRAMIFCDWIEQGQALADALDVPFIHGATAHKLEKVQESDVCVVSRVGDRGISLPDLRLVVEVAGAGSAREQFAQRVGRLLHGEFEGEFHTVFTPEEAARFRGRIFGVEAELAGEVDIEFIAVGNVSEESSRKSTRQVRSPRSSSAVRYISDHKQQRSDEPNDEFAQMLRLPAISAKIMQAKKSVGDRTAPYIERVMRYCWNAALSPTEIVEGLGILDAATKSRMNSACSAVVKLGLMKSEQGGRYAVNKEELNRLKILSGLKM